MMNLIRAIYNALVGSTLVTHNVYPRAADGAAAAAVTLAAAAVAWTWGAYVQIVAATIGDSQVEGISLENFVGAASQGEIQIAQGGVGAEIAFATIQSTNANKDWAKGTRIPAGTRLAARYRTSTGAADTIDVKVNVVEGI